MTLLLEHLLTRADTISSEGYSTIVMKQKYDKMLAFQQNCISKTPIILEGND